MTRAYVAMAVLFYPDDVSAGPWPALVARAPVALGAGVDLLAFDPDRGEWAVQRGVPEGDRAGPKGPCWVALQNAPRPQMG